ncbi:MAG: PNGase F N-terminal domain-containing protein [Bacteroidota bacterium]
MKNSFRLNLLTAGLLIMATLMPDLALAGTGTAKITYKQVVNGRTMDRGGKTILLAGYKFAISYNDRSGTNLIPQIPVEKEYQNFRSGTAWQVANLYDGTAVHQKSSFSVFPELTLTGETAEILGFRCVKATASLRSNSLEIWFTQDLNLHGTPQMAYGLPDGLVLKTVRNGNFEMVADSVEFLKPGEMALSLPSDIGEEADQALYRHRITNSYITTVKVFDDEQLSWGNLIENPEGEVLNATYHFAGGTVVMKKIRLPEVSADHMVFAELSQYANGDAYDRTGSVFIVPVDQEKSMMDALREGIDGVPFFEARNGKKYQGMTATENFLPAIELIRFFTPFGVRHFNDQVRVYGQEWEDVAFYKQDLTGLLPLLQGEVWIGTFIGNYDKGGHKISLDLKYYPGSQVVREQTASCKWFKPLFNTLNFMEMAGQNYGTLFDTDSLTVVFDVPEGVENLTLRYITTGHGGWGGGDEFNQKLNEIFIDGERVYSFIPWRTDCGTFRKYNPASGNFWNGVTSSDYSRSGWCPGGITDPNYIPLPGLSPGRHTIRVAIPLGKPEGGSFSAWCVSGLIMGDYQE